MESSADQSVKRTRCRKGPDPSTIPQTKSTTQHVRFAWHANIAFYIANIAISLLLSWVKFEWDERKEAANIAKHGIGFSEAQSVFADSKLVIAADEAHSKSEPRLFCIGRSEAGGILTVRFTFRRGIIRIIGAGYWRKGKILYEKQNQIRG